MHQVQVCNVYAKLHRGRADQVGQTAAELARLAGVAVLPAKTALAPLTFARRDHLGGCVRAPSIAASAAEEAR